MQVKNYSRVFSLFCSCIIVSLAGFYIFSKQLGLETSLENLRKKVAIDNVEVARSTKRPKDLKEYIFSIILPILLQLTFSGQLFSRQHLDRDRIRSQCKLLNINAHQMAATFD